MVDKKYVLLKVTDEKATVTYVKREDYPQMLVFNGACAKHPSIERGYASEIHPFAKTLVKDVVGGGKNSHVLLLAEKEYLIQAKRALWGYVEHAGVMSEENMEKELRSLKIRTQKRIRCYYNSANVLLRPACAR